jgi:subtilisin family serine protease
MNRCRYRKFILLFSAMTLLNFFFFTNVSAQNLKRTPTKDNLHPKMSSYLKKLEKDYNEGTGSARVLAKGANISSQTPDKVTVFLISESDASIDEEAVNNLGAQIIKHAGNVIKAKVPVDMLTSMADTVSGVSFIKAPDKLIPVAIESEGVNLTGANIFHQAGYDGSGVKIAVIDVGFDNLDVAIANGELPSDIIKIDCTGASCEPSSFSSVTETERHGTAVSEIVYDMAPGATLYLIKITDIMDLEDAKDFAIKNGIKIINHSLVVPNTNFYDGECWSLNGIVNAVCTADDAWANNILWVNAAGNEAQRHYWSDYSDTDNDGWHNVSGTNETIRISANAGDSIEIYLTWDAWQPTSDQDYDLYLFDSSFDPLNPNPVASSQNNQTGTQLPTESIVYPDTSKGTYYISIRQESATSNHRLQLYSINHILNPAVSDRSLLSPADAAGAMTVGAINYNNWSTGEQESFSSQGPTNDGRIKPDIMGPDNVSTDAYGFGFFGTSASSPHVAGAAALILHKFPGLSADDLWKFLTETAIDMGSTGRDNVYGYGRLNLDIDAFITDNSNIVVGDSGSSNGIVGDGGGGGCFISTAAYRP